MTAVRSVAAAAGELGNTFRGELLEPGDAGYDEARKVHNGLVDKYPALIAQCRNPADVAKAIKLTQQLGLEVAIRGGGHNVAGRATIDGGVMIVLFGAIFLAIQAAWRQMKLSPWRVAQPPRRLARAYR